ncbi:MFS transporter [Streptomyces sp. NBC_00210]|uniref:MFS transporter n=1 Tax=Streptomyces sp. NBC_00210 TaxID=2903636 RepID=UPI00324A3E64
MLFPTSRVPARADAPCRRVRRLERKLLVYAGLEDLILLYPVYAVLFAEHGLSTAEISSLFAIWSLTGLLVEVPSGIWADAVSRRALLIAGPLLSAAGFALWVLLPSYAAFASGFVLWGTGGALRSGAMEALVYEELDRLGAASRYIRLMGRAAAVSMAATAVATAAAGPVFAVGGYGALGVASVAACLLCALTAAALPEHRDGSPGDPADGADRRRARYAGTLTAGLREVRGSRSVRNALVMAVVLSTVWGALDEYIPLLATELGASTQEVPFLVLVVWAGVTMGSLLAERAGALSARAMAAVVATAGAVMAAGALSGTTAGFALLGLAFLVFQMADVVADARLQSAITGTSRATVTSLAGLGTGVATLMMYAAYGAASRHTGHGLLFALFAVPYLGVALALARRPSGRADDPAEAAEAAEINVKRLQ